MRCFLALTLKTNTKKQIAHFQGQLTFKGRTRLVSSKQFHITLFFWPHLNNKNLSRVKTILHQLDLQSFKPLTLNFKSLSGFPTPQKARIVVLEIESQKLKQLYLQLLQQLKQADIPLEEREFTPHLTLARIYPPQDLSLCPRFTPLQDQAHSLTLFSSTLTAQGAIHKPLLQLPLQSDTMK